ncbi:MAG: hypothetical protein IKB97_06575 [Bacteroidaceae bacterium]|nr:hypothetical protein [Bacteroidaceae bacterium]
MNTIVKLEKKQPKNKKDVRDWLNEYRFTENHIATITHRLTDTINLLEEASKLLETDPEAINQNELVSVEESVDRLKRTLHTKITALQIECMRTLDIVESIPSPEIRKVIEDHYFKNMTLEACAIDMGISLSKVKYLHQKGLDYLEDFC